MIETLLELPDEYRVHKSIDKQLFINNPNSTDREKQLLMDYLQTISIEYDIKFQLDSSEFLVIEADVNEGTFFQLRTIAKIIGASMPYPCAVFLNYNGYIHMWMFEYIAGTKNPNRKTISGCFEIKLGFPYHSGLKSEFYKALQCDISASVSADVLEEMWKYEMSILKKEIQKRHKYGRR